MHSYAIRDVMNRCAPPVVNIKLTIEYHRQDAVLHQLEVILVFALG